MGSLLDNRPLMEYRDFVTEFAGGQPVADIDCCLIPGDLVKFGVYLRLRDWVKGGCWFIQYDKGRVFVQCAGNGDFLGFAAGYIHSIFLVIRIKICV